MSRTKGSFNKKSTGIPNTKLGATSRLGSTPETFLRNYYERKQVLRIPPEILQANKDKHFCFVNMNKLQKNGMWHSGGYQLYRTDTDSESQYKEKFNQPLDPYLHRNELVLAYIPQEEFELRQMEREVARGRRDLSELILKDSALSSFSPHSKIESEVMDYSEAPSKSNLDHTVNLGG